MSRARTSAVWILAVLLTLASAAWQRRSGPTYPLRGETLLAGETLAYRLERSHVTSSDQEVRIRVGTAPIEGTLLWRRYPTRDPFVEQAMTREGEELVARLPAQAAAGKLEYKVRLARGAEAVTIPDGAAVTRFKGDVPAPVLVPHILAMFLGMLFSNAAGFAALFGAAGARRHGFVSLVLLSIGGLALGPLVQKYAFDAWWTGFPFGTDLTDNKTAIAIVAWIVALWIGARSAERSPGRARVALVAAALVTLAVFAVPHSLFGSEIKWEETPPAAAGR